MDGHQVAHGWFVLYAWAPSGSWLLRLECMGTKWQLVGKSGMHGHQVSPGWYVLNAWAPSGLWLARLEYMGIKWPMVRSS